MEALFVQTHWCEWYSILPCVIARSQLNDQRYFIAATVLINSPVVWVSASGSISPVQYFFGLCILNCFDESLSVEREYIEVCVWFSSSLWRAYRCCVPSHIGLCHFQTLIICQTIDHATCSFSSHFCVYVSALQVEAFKMT